MRAFFLATLLLSSACDAPREGEGRDSTPATRDDGGGADDASAADGTTDERGAMDSGEGDGRALAPSDVSILLPLPPTFDYASLPTAETIGRDGQPLIPAAALEALPQLHPGAPAGASIGSELRLLGIRFDPCFSSTTGGACDPQIRLVFQPALSGAEPRDAAVHAFYRFSREEFASIVSSLRTLAEMAPENEGAYLGPSPAIAAQGYGGEYYGALRELLLFEVGSSRLVRLTFMARVDDNGLLFTWEFGGLEVEGDRLTPIRIAEIDVERQMLTLTQDFMQPRYHTQPEDSGVLAPILDEFVACGGPGCEIPPEDREVAYRRLLTLENPMLLQPDEAQCALCHVAHPVARRNEGLHGLDALMLEERFARGSLVERSEESDQEPSSVRAFGYFGARPAISARVANETQAVLDRLAESR